MLSDETLQHVSARCLSGLCRMLMPTEGLINVSGIYPPRLDSQRCREGICHDSCLFSHRDRTLTEGEGFEHEVTFGQEIISWACDTEKRFQLSEKHQRTAAC